MVPKRKIRLMTRLAIYDKKYGRRDKKKTEYFMWDYIYFKNFATRTAALCGSLILTFFYVLKKMLVDQVNIFELDLKAEGAKIGFAVVCLLLVYTLIGTHVAKNEYNKSTGRLKKYFAMLDRVDSYEKYIAKQENAESYTKNNGADKKYNYAHNKPMRDDIATPLPTSIKDQLVYTKIRHELAGGDKYNNTDYRDHTKSEEFSMDFNFDYKNASARQQLLDKYGNNNKR